MARVFDRDLKRDAFSAAYSPSPRPQYRWLASGVRLGCTGCTSAMRVENARVRRIYEIINEISKC